MKYIKALSLGLLCTNSAMASGKLSCKAGGMGPGAAALNTMATPVIKVGKTDVTIELLSTGFDSLVTTAEPQQMKRRAICTGPWEQTVKLPFYGRLIGVEYSIASATFDFRDTTSPASEAESMKILGGNIYVKGAMKIGTKADVFEKNLKFAAPQDLNEAKVAGRGLFPLQISNVKRTLRENNSLCGPELRIRLDEISANVFKNDLYALASASIIIPKIRLKFVAVKTTDKECIK